MWTRVVEQLGFYEYLIPLGRSTGYSIDIKEKMRTYATATCLRGEHNERDT